MIIVSEKGNKVDVTFKYKENVKPHNLYELNCLFDVKVIEADNGEARLMTADYGKGLKKKCLTFKIDGKTKHLILSNQQLWQLITEAIKVFPDGTVFYKEWRNEDGSVLYDYIKTKSGWETKINTVLC